MDCGYCDTSAGTCVRKETGVYNDESLDKYGVRRQHISVIARSFYGAMALNMLTKGAYKPAYDAIVADAADQIARAIILACVGEARYDVNHALYGMWAFRRAKGRNTNVPLKLYQLPYIKIMQNSRLREDRAGTASTVAMITNPLDIKFVRTLRNIFLWAGRFHYGRHSSYGGMMWASCAQTVLDWLAGRTTVEEFIDTAFDARHNGAPVLTKVLTQTGYDNSWLSARSEASLAWLARWAPNTVRTQFGYTECVPLALTRPNLTYGTSEGFDVIPDERTNAEQAAEFDRRGTIAPYAFYNKSGSADKLAVTLIARLSEKERYFRTKACLCEHCTTGKNKGLWYEHDCKTLCVSTGCSCASTSARFVPQSDGDDEDEDEDEYCTYCEGTGHITEDCEDYSECACKSCEKAASEYCPICARSFCGYCTGSTCHLDQHEDEDEGETATANTVPPDPMVYVPALKAYMLVQTKEL